MLQTMDQKTLVNNWENVVAPVRNDILFKDKNQSYGAYALRKNHNRNLAFALLITGSVFFLIVSAPAIIDWFNNLEEEVVVPISMTEVNLTPPPPLDDNPPPPPPPPPPPIMKTIKFTPPVVKDEIVEEEPPPIQLEEPPQIAIVTQEGSEDEIIIPDEITEVVAPAADQIWAWVPEPPEFPGGLGAMYSFIKKKVVYPQMEKEAGITGTCTLSFVVEKDGSITDVKVLKGVPSCKACDREAVRVVRMMPNWAPGRQSGNPARVQFTLPIKFKLK